jgi:formylglycine-generating enzyme required for sulfatase activity
MNNDQEKSAVGIQNRRSKGGRTILPAILGAAAVVVLAVLVIALNQGEPVPPRPPKVPVPEIVNTTEVPASGTDWKLETLDLNMKWIEPGDFVMGSPEDEAGRKDNESAHQVTLTRGYWLAVFEIRHRDWEKFRDATGYQSEAERQTLGYGTWVFDAEKAEILQSPSANWTNIHALGPDHPVQALSWNDVMAFCEWLTTTEREAGRLDESQKYTLPTEAQWEFACRERGKVLTPFYFGATLESHQANFNGHQPYGTDRRGEFLNKTLEVGSYPPNALGIYDMHGNTFEWCRDGYQPHDSSAVTDPEGDPESDRRIYKGGSWLDVGIYCRAAFRGNTIPTDRSDHLGARIALVQE